MELLWKFVGLQCFFRAVLALKCYECTIYEDRETGNCDIVECPNRYNHCSNSTYIPVTDIATRECYHQSDKGQRYRGSWNVPISTSGCLNWLKANLTYNPTAYPEIGLGDHNYCRNPDGDVRPWCYTSAGGDFAYCTLPKCFKHQVKVVELTCGWLSKSYCVNEPLGEECMELCDTDLCNKPAFIKELTTAAPTTRPIATTFTIAARTTTSTVAASTTMGPANIMKSKVPAQVNSTSAARLIEKDTEAGKSQELSDDDGDGGDAAANKPPFLLIFTSLAVLTWLNIAVTE